MENSVDWLHCNECLIKTKLFCLSCGHILCVKCLKEILSAHEAATLLIKNEGQSSTVCLICKKLFRWVKIQNDHKLLPKSLQPYFKNCDDMLAQLPAILKFQCHHGRYLEGNLLKIYEQAAGLEKREMQLLKSIENIENTAKRMNEENKKLKMYLEYKIRESTLNIGYKSKDFEMRNIPFFSNITEPNFQQLRAPRTIRSSVENDLELMMEGPIDLSSKRRQDSGFVSTSKSPG